jgi:hypothetical protein
MVQETWTTVAVPLLEQVLAGEVSDPNAATAAVLASANQDAAVNRTLAALLDDGYLAGATPHWPLGGSRPHIVADVLRLTPKGRRAVGQWPSGQTGNVLIQVLETTVMQMPEGEAKSRLHAFLAAAQQVGTDVLSQVVTNVIKSATGLP